jgi:hypothetical protein
MKKGKCDICGKIRKLKWIKPLGNNVCKKCLISHWIELAKDLWEDS